MRFKSFLVILSFFFATSHASASLIYTFSATVDSVKNLGSSSQDQDAIEIFKSHGIKTGTKIEFEVLLDKTQFGTKTDSSGVTTTLPRYEAFGVLTDQHHLYYHADLGNASIPWRESEIPLRENNYFQNYTYWNYNSSYGRYHGNILVGDMGHLVNFRKESEWEDRSAFVENWSVGDSVDFSIRIGEGRDYALGTAELISKVPLPGALIFLSTGLAALFLRRRNWGLFRYGKNLIVLCT